MNTPAPLQIEHPSFDAAAIVLAGGFSRRMKTDKSFLDIKGMPLISSIIMQLKTCFPAIIISTNNPTKYSFLDLPMVQDDPPHGGPAAGILAGMKASAFDFNFVMACDIPIVHRHIISSLFAEIGDHDGALPSRGSDLWEPFFALYHRRMISVLENVMSGENFWMRTVLDAADIITVEVDPFEWPNNINTSEEYRAFLRDIT